MHLVGAVGDAQGAAVAPEGRHRRVVGDAQRAQALDGPVEHTVFVLRNPDRVVVDLRRAKLTGRLPSRVNGDRILRGIRGAPRNGSDLRVVFEIADQVVVLRHGRVVEDIPVHKFMDGQRDAYTQMLIDAVPGKAAEMAAPSNVTPIDAMRDKSADVDVKKGAIAGNASL